MKKRRFTYCIAIAIFIASCLPLTAICQQDFNANAAMNWTVEQTFISPTVSSTPDHIPFKANFYDGLGRRIQTIEGSLGGDIQCIADYVEYNVRGQICRQWLPAPAYDKTGSFTSLSVLKNEYEYPASAFQQSLYEDTPAARIIESRKPGLDSWGTYSGITSQYLYNTTSGDFSCMRLCVKDGKLSCPGLYDKGELQVTETTDEDDNRIIEFKDIWNQCVLSRSITKSGTVADTYYAYDVYGRLRVIISPKGSLSIKKGWQTSLTDNNLTSIAHTFEYDDYGRISRMSVPGAGSSRFAYTYSGKTCYSQNPIQALEDSWAYQTYDGLGRPAYSGTLKVESGEPVESFSLSNSTYFSPQEETAIFGYHRTLSWAKEENCLSADFYDDYSFLNLFPEQEQQLAYTANLGFGLRGDTGTSGFTTKGHKTGSVRRIIKPDNTEELLISAYYYDDQGRVIQTRSNNHMGGTEVTFSALSFDGRVTQARTAHSSENASVSATHLYTYDCLGAPKTISYKGSTPVTELIAYEYDELHRINLISMLDDMLPVEYSYTPEGALESISSVPFSQTLFREMRPDGSQGYLNGLVSAQNFSICSTSPGVDTPDTQGVEATYNYTYDGMRLMSAIYAEKSRRVPLPVNSRWRPDLHYRPNYSTIYNYDTNGNITELARFGHVDTEVISTSFGSALFNQNRHLYDLVDNLTLKYDGNRLIKVSDSAEDSDLASSNDFVDGKDSGDEYEYDAMGRLIRDDNKGITQIKYNVLGLPSDIYVNTCHIRYTYDADCRLLRKEYGHDALKLIEPTSPFGAWISKTVFEQTSSQDWSGNCEYLDGKFSRCFHSAGWVDSHGKHTAVVKDYQGNIRATWKEGDYVVANPEESQRAKSMLYSNVTGYYPYGLPWSNLQATDRYLYSGKDLDRTNGLMLYDFHARLYDPQLGRFLQHDPCSSAYASHSPWLYCLANPIMYTDPSGMIVVYDEYGEFFKYENDGTENRAMLVPVFFETNGGNFNDSHDACNAYMFKQGLYLIITPELISQIEEISKLTETNNQEYGFGMFTDGTVSSVKSGSFNHVELEYSKSELFNHKGEERNFLGEIHTHNLGPTWIEKKQAWEIGITGPSDKDRENLQGTIGVVIGFDGKILNPNVSQNNRFASPVYDILWQNIGFYNKDGLVANPMKLKTGLDKMKNILQKQF